jgi:ABC-type sugar transport system permease subunit
MMIEKIKQFFKRNEKTKKSERENKKTPYLLMIPWLIGMVIFVFIPIIMILFMSVNDVLKTPLGYNFEFAGIDNYLGAFTNPEFYQALIQYVVLLFTYVPIIVIISFLIAMLLNENFKGRTAFRVLFFLPVVLLSNATISNVSGVSAGENALLNVDGVFVFSMIESYIPFFATFLQNMFSVIILILWFTGVPIVLYINGLKKINTAIYEAAQIDGANAWQILWLVIIPNIRSTALVIAIFSVVQVGIYNINPLYGILQEQISMTATNLGNAATYSILYTIVTFLFIGLMILILREKEVVNQEQKRYTKTQELYEKQKAMEVKTVESN